MLGMNSADLVAPEDRERAAQGIRETLEKGSVSLKQYTLLRRDGSTFIGELSAGLIRDASGAPKAFIGTVRDITARRKVDEALRASEEKYRDLVENINEVIYALDSNGVITYMSPTLEAVSGYKPSEMIGRPFHEFVDKRDLPATLDNFRTVLTGAYAPSEFRFRSAAGEIRWARSSGKPVFADDRVVGVHGVLSDITVRKIAEERVQFLGSIAEQAKDAFVVTDLDFNVTYMNRAAEGLFEYKLEELRGKDPIILNAEPNSREIQDEICKTIQSGGVWQGTVLNRRKDGSTFSCETRVAPLRDENGRIASYLGIQRDVTEKRQLQEQLLQAQKMEAVGTLAGGIAHDFNNMLTAIIGYSELLLAGCDKDSKLLPDIREIGSVARKAAELTRQLLSFSRRQIIKVSPIDLNANVKRLESMLRRLIGEDIELVIDAGRGLGAIKADAGQIEQVVMNLVLNARDAMPDGGRLTIKTDAVSLDAEACKLMPEAKPGRWVRLCVSDTGLGMDGENIRHIFEPFYTTKEAGRGTGLGLSAVYGIVKQHEGWIDVESEAGRGSTFRIYLPSLDVKAEQPVEDAVADSDIRGSGERILLVEDEEGIRRLAVRALVSRGYRVVEAADAKEAYSIFDREKGGFDLIFCDMVLPDRSGLEVAEVLRSRRRGIPILLTSGYTDRRLHWPAIQKKGYAFLKKPYELVDLVRAVRDAVKVR
jgi:two-component system cell cycle sensor histidine kinase/response regulator CckA